LRLKTAAVTEAPQAETPTGVYSLTTRVSLIAVKSHESTHTSTRSRQQVVISTSGRRRAAVRSFLPGPLSLSHSSLQPSSQTPLISVVPPHTFKCLTNRRQLQVFTELNNYYNNLLNCDNKFKYNVLSSMKRVCYKLSPKNAKLPKQLPDCNRGSIQVYCTDYNNDQVVVMQTRACLQSYLNCSCFFQVFFVIFC